MKAYKKKLPRYWLGTRQPTSLGYQQSQGIGNAQFTSVQGDDVLPEARAAEQNIVPSAIGKTTPYLSTIAQMYSGYTSKAAAASAGTKAGLSTAGKAAGAVGAVVGAADIAQQYINQGSHRSTGDMLATRTTNTYSTPGGNQYTEYGGLNTGAELRYETANTRSKQLNNLLSWTGEGATIGSFFPGWGTLIGAGIGALVGGVTNVAGFGDNEDEVRQQMRNIADFTAMQNRQNRSVAESQDVKDAFYTRAADGLAPSFGYKDSELAGRKMSTVTNHGVDTRKVNALVSNGETIVPKEVAERGRALPGFNNGYTIPGTPNTDDKIPAHIKASDTILSGHGASQYYQATGDYYGALAMDEAHRDKISKDSMYSKMYRAKNGKLPKYVLGTVGEQALATLPHFGQYLENLAQYNRANKASTYVPQMELQNPYGTRAINQAMSDMIDPREYLNQSMRNYNQAAWQARRNPVLGAGGRAIALDSLYRAKLSNDADTLMKIDMQNRGQRNMGAQMLEKYGNVMLDKNYDQYWRRWGAQQQANAAKENWLAQYSKNKVMAGINGAADMLRVIQSNRANDIQKRLIRVYEDKQQFDKQSYQDSINQRNQQQVPSFYIMPGFTPADAPYLYMYQS